MDVIYYVVLVINFVILLYILIKSKKGNISNILSYAVDKSSYNPTIFKIYDKSTKVSCNRLIVVEPFSWFLWAINGKLYILNPEGGISCSNTNTPAIQVTATKFIEVCLNLNYTSILDMYMLNVIPRIINYEIKTQTFTILTALNLLTEDWVTFDIDENDNNLHESVNPKGKELNKKIVKKREIGRHVSNSEVLEIMNNNFKHISLNVLAKEIYKHKPK